MRASCTLSGIAHSKAWEMINKLEQMLDCQIVECARGGKSGGSTRLTQAGLDFYFRFTRFEERVYQFAQEEFQKVFPLRVAFLHKKGRKKFCEFP